MEEKWGLARLVRRFVLPLARNHAWTSFCEIGASKGDTADEVLSLPGISYAIVDPCFDRDLVLQYAGDARVRVHKGNSLDVLPKLEGDYDCILVDGDHNWYTVRNELRIVRERGMLHRGGMIFLHDVEWPYGRRDLYYQPETIPHEYRWEYERKGIVRGRSQLVESGGTNAQLCHCVREGGPKNGVLTAIEDFIAEHPADYNFSRIRYEFGLGILQYRRNRLSEEAAFKAVQIKAGLLSACSFLPSMARALRQTLREVR